MTESITQQDFEKLAIGLKKEIALSTERLEKNHDKQFEFISELAKNLEQKIDKTFRNFTWFVSVFCVVFTAFYGFLFYFVDNRYSTRLDRLEVASYTVSKDLILQEIREIKNDIEFVRMGGYHNQKGIHTPKQKKKQGTRKINSVYELENDLYFYRVSVPYRDPTALLSLSTK